MNGVVGICIRYRRPDKIEQRSLRCLASEVGARDVLVSGRRWNGYSGDPDLYVSHLGILLWTLGLVRDSYVEFRGRGVGQASFSEQ